MKKEFIKKSVCMILLLAVVLSTVALAGCGAKEAAVPDVVGMTKADAEKALTDAGFTMTVQRERFSPRNPAGSVDKMITEAGTKAAAGTEVKVILSLGEGIPLPNLSVLSGKEAETYLKALDLKPIIEEEYSDEVEEGNVISYTDAGNTVPVGSEVTVKVSKGPKP